MKHKKIVAANQGSLFVSGHPQSVKECSLNHPDIDHLKHEPERIKIQINAIEYRFCASCAAYLCSQIVHLLAKNQPKGEPRP